MKPLSCFGPVEISVAVLGLLRWICPPTSQLGDVANVNANANAQAADGGACPAATYPQPEERCDREIVIFTDVKPENIFAVTTILRQALETHRRLSCQPEQFPVKHIFTGGGSSSSLWHDTLRTFLQKLQDEKIVPISFSIRSRVHQGPTALDADDARWGPVAQAYQDSLALQTGRPYTQNQSETILDSLRHAYVSVEAKIARLNAPTIVALRPIHEFAVWWTEATAEAQKGAVSRKRLQLTPQYAQLRKTINAWHRPNKQEQRKAFGAVWGRSKLVTFQGGGNLAGMSRLLETQILDADTTADMGAMTNELEQAYFNLPSQVIIVDRKSLLRGISDMPIFTRRTQAEVWNAFRHVGQSSTQQDLVKAFTLLTEAYNEPLITDAQTQVTQFLDANAPVHHPAQSRARLRSKFDDLQARAQELAKNDMMWSDDKDEYKTWATEAVNNGTQMERSERVRQGTNWNPGYAATVPPRRGGRSRVQVAYKQWMNVAPSRSTYLELNSLMVPLATSSLDSVVAQNYQQVQYPDRSSITVPDDPTIDPDDAFLFPPAGDASSTIWRTTAPQAWTTDPDGAAVLRASNDLMADLRRTYLATFTRIVIYP
ncbi:MAG: hypothetical protein M1838_002207 [Thelocarpon superellum]|nr:MAG: hypothetical protein M1838_002207 [Thelocarpon superellum]